ncbi:hypothetical protein D3C74_183940 [compost metagenome]
MILRKMMFVFLVIFLLVGSMGFASLSAEGNISSISEAIDGITPSSDDLSDPDSFEQIGSNSEISESPGISKDNTVTDSVYRIELMASNTELIINHGDSIEFKNNMSRATTITTNAKPTNDIRYDYVTYDSEGRILSEDMGHTGSITVRPNGGITVITVDYPLSLTVEFNPELSYSYSYAPALLKKVITRGESYVFSNQGFSARNIMSDATTSNGKLYDFAVYESDGSMEKSSFATFTKPTFSVGDEIVLTGASDEPVTIAVPYVGYSGYETDEPAYDSVQLYQGESYTFTNVGMKSDRIEHSGTTKDKFDYVVYNSDGTETSRGANTSTMPLVAVGRYVVITLVTENSVRVGAPYRSFMGRDRENEAISRVTLSPGDSFKFTNNGSLLNPVNNNAREVDGLYDYTVYKADGSYSSQGFDSISTPQLPAGGFAIITVQGISDVTFDYTDDFLAEVSDEPSHFRVTLSLGESYEFKNITSSIRILRSNATSSNRFDWVEYYPDGTQQGKSTNTYTDPQVSGGNSIVVTAVSAPVIFGANYRLFSWKEKPGEAISKQTIQFGESYSFTNTGSRLITLTSNARDIGGKYDVAVYDEDGSVYNVGFNDTGNVAIPAGGYAILTGQSSSPITISYTDTFNVTAAPHPALLRAIVAPGSSYTYENISSEIERLYSEGASETNEFAYVIRRPDGTVYSEYLGHYTSVLVQSGYSITVTPVTGYVSFGAVYTSFTGTPGENPSVKQVIINKNESYLFTNLQSSQQTLTSDAKVTTPALFDFAIYLPDGKIEEAKFDHDGNLSIPAESQVVVTVTTDSPVTFTYGRFLQALPSAEPALLKQMLEAEQRVGFKNTGSFEAKLITNASASGNRFFDYTILDGRGNIVRQGEHATISYNIPAGGSVQVKTTSANPVLFTAPYRVFKFVDVQEYVFEDLLHRQELYVYKEAGKNGYYGFTAPETGRYRFATKELQNFALLPVISLYDQPDLKSSLASSEGYDQEHGVDYTVLEFDLTGGKTYYLKLNEKNSISLEMQLMASIMAVAPEAKFDYKPDGRLNEIVFPTGDKLIYEYDSNGNLKRRTKKVFPFL